MTDEQKLRSIRWVGSPPAVVTWSWIAALGLFLLAMTVGRGTGKALALHSVLVVLILDQAHGWQKRRS